MIGRTNANLALSDKLCILPKQKWSFHCQPLHLVLFDNLLGCLLCCTKFLLKNMFVLVTVYMSSKQSTLRCRTWDFSVCQWVCQTGVSGIYLVAAVEHVAHAMLNRQSCNSLKSNVNFCDYDGNYHKENEATAFVCCSFLVQFHTVRVSNVCNNWQSIAIIDK